MHALKSLVSSFAAIVVSFGGLSLTAQAQIGCNWIPISETYATQVTPGATVTPNATGGAVFQIPAASALVPVHAWYRFQNISTTSPMEFQGDVTVDSFAPPANNVGILEIIQTNLPTALLLLDIRNVNGGQQFVDLEGGAVMGPVTIGIPYQINVIFDLNAGTVSVYINGSLAEQKTGQSGAGELRIGEIAAIAGSGPATVTWSNVHFWTGGSIICNTCNTVTGIGNIPFASPQSGTFGVTWDATPSGSPMNATMSVCLGNQTAYSGLACIVRFNPSGDIDVRNGGTYQSVGTIPYFAGSTYHFAMTVNVPAHTYSVYLSYAPLYLEQLVASNYAFRTEQSAVTSLDTFNINISGGGSVNICNLTVRPPQNKVADPVFNPSAGIYNSAQDVAIASVTPGALIRYTTDGSMPSETSGTLYSGLVQIDSTTTLRAIAYESGWTDSNVTTGTYTIQNVCTTVTGISNIPMPSPQSGTFTVKWDATPSGSPMNATMALANGSQTAYSGLACIARFNPTGDIDARNGGAYQAAATIPYTTGTTYHFRMVVNVPAHTYSVFLDPPPGSLAASQIVASNYAFRTEQGAVTSLNTFNVDVASGGSVSICNLTFTSP
jgi:hypothetical protein